ncbi:hypothetical protein SGLAM104S_01916 [Streptomyces glaucescens]
MVHGLLAAATVAGAVHGYRVLLAVSRILAIGMTALLVLGLIAYAPDFTTGALEETGGYLLGGFWPTWVLAAVAAGLSGPVAGFARCRGVYDAEALQVFNRRARGGLTGSRRAGTSRPRRHGRWARWPACWRWPCRRTRARCWR